MALSILQYTPLLAVVYLISFLVYRAFFHPLSKVPGPLICRLSSIWTWYHSYIGDEGSQINALHDKYGPVVRIAPNEVIIADGAALAPIYSEKGGFLKAACYTNFDIEGHSTIFSALDPSHRAVRSKAVLPMFSMNSIRAGNDTIQACVDRFVARMKEEADESRSTRQPVNVLNLTRSLALDAVSSFLFGKSFGGIGEKTNKLSATEFVDALVAVGRYFYLPNWLFLALETGRQKFFPTNEESASSDKVDGFVGALVQKSEKSDTSYQGRLLKVGIAVDEVEVQCKDLVFAGTDSTGTNLSTICWQLAKHPEIYATLRAEIAHADATLPADYNPQTLPYLDAVVREGLRISMANPTRFPRVVPPSGWTFTTSTTSSSSPQPETYHFPPSTIVGLQPFTLHFNPLVFPDPFTFKPSRWLAENNPTPEMQRDAIPFGLGPRQCIARNLAQMELFLAVRSLARAGVLEGARAVGERIVYKEWFNSHILGDRIEILWE